jgi:hypothetical protein
MQECRNAGMQESEWREKKTKNKKQSSKINEYRKHGELTLTPVS